MAKAKAKAKVAEVTEVKDVAETTPKVDGKIDPVLDEENDKKVPSDVEEDDISEKKIEKEIKKVEEKMVMGKVRNKVYQKTSYIKMKSLRSYPCNYELPENIRKYLNNRWWWANVIEKDEEWLVKRKANMEIIEELKKYLSEHYF